MLLVSEDSYENPALQNALQRENLARIALFAYSCSSPLTNTGIEASEKSI
ncbi:MAG: hypothetical protein QOI57_114, partial [Rubrobacteraceae bacterium]|nr:hypothetical protein [Rubrobacteraceae bacterium]